MDILYIPFMNIVATLTSPVHRLQPLTCWIRHRNNTKEIILDIAEICLSATKSPFDKETRRPPYHPVNQNCVGKYTAEN